MKEKSHKYSILLSRAIEILISNNLVISRNKNEFYLTKFELNYISHRYSIINESGIYKIFSNKKISPDIIELSNILNEDENMLHQIIDNIRKKSGNFQLVITDARGSVVSFNIFYKNFSLETQHNPIFGYSNDCFRSHKMIDLLSGIFYSKNYLLTDLMFQYKLKKAEVFLDYLRLIQSVSI